MFSILFLCEMSCYWSGIPDFENLSSILGGKECSCRWETGKTGVPSASEMQEDGGHLRPRGISKRAPRETPEWDKQQCDIWSPLICIILPSSFISSLFIVLCHWICEQLNTQNTALQRTWPNRLTKPCTCLLGILSVTMRHTVLSEYDSRHHGTS